MRIRVKFFAIVRQLAGVSDLDIDLPNKARISDARLTIQNEIPALNGYLDRVAWALNQTYVGTAAELSDGDELAIIPPVSGGCDG